MRFSCNFVSEKSRHSRAPHVLFLLGNLSGGGAQRTSVLLANWLAETKHFRVSMVVVSEKLPAAHKVSPKISVVGLRSGRSSLAVFQLSNILGRLKPSHVVAAQRHVNVLAILATGFPWRRACELVIWEKNILRPPERGSFDAKNQILLLLMKISYSMASRLIVNSPDTLTSLQRAKVKVPRRVHLLPNPVETSVVLPREIRVSAPPCPYIVAVGRLVWQKGFDVLIRAYAGLPRKSHRLVIVGSGPELKYLESLSNELGVRDYVDFVGWHRRPEKIVSGADLFVLSSRWEGFGNVIVEALQLGVPVVASDCPGGPSWILEGGRFGALVRPDCAVDLSEAIDAMLASQPNVADLKEKGDRYRLAVLGEQFLARVLDL